MLQSESLLVIESLSVCELSFFKTIFKVFWVLLQICASVLCHLQLEVRDTAGCLKI